MKKYVLIPLLLSACSVPPPGDPKAPVADSVALPVQVENTPVVDGFEQLRGSDGRVSMEGNKRGGKRHGLWTSYTKDGRVKSRNTYSDGKLDGECVVFRENGQLYYTGGYANDKEVGEWKFYGPDGTLERTVEH